MSLKPPRLFLRLFRWFCHPALKNSIGGDLMELYTERCNTSGKRKANVNFIIDVLLLFRPGIIRPAKEFKNINHYDMYSNYLKVGMRNMMRQKGFSFINIAGLSAGMAVAMLIGFWIWDELSYNKYHKNYQRIASVMQHLTYNGQVGTQSHLPFPVAEVLRTNYGNDFKYVVSSSGNSDHVLSQGDKKLKKVGNFMEPDGPLMLTLKMASGSVSGLNDPASILISTSTAKAFFNDINPVGEVMQIDNKEEVKVTGVYEDIASNSDFAGTAFIAPFELHVARERLREMADPWGWNGWMTYVQLADNADLNEVSERIRILSPKKDDPYKPQFFLNPMEKWHLYSGFENGVRKGGGIEFVWLFGIIGTFILLLACINFMNLSTARSEKRAKEIGIRKSVGSLRGQLITQFLSESLLTVALAFVMALCIVQLALPFFNYVAEKQMSILWSSPSFWLSALVFSLFTGIVAGSYPAIYLSSFQPLKALKGTFKSGRLAAIPRKVLVVIQFTVSVTLIIGTIVVFRQIQFAKNRPVGFERHGVVMMQMIDPAIHNHFDAVQAELKASGAIVEMAESGSPVTDVWSTSGGISWEGRDPRVGVDFPNTRVSYDYGKTVGWRFIEGRDFSREFATDSSAFILNKSAVEFMGLKNPVGQVLTWEGKPFRIVGVIEDVVLSPYNKPRPSLFHLARRGGNFVIVKLNAEVGTSEALRKVELTFKKYDPKTPFDYQFADTEYAKKFQHEERVGKLATVFSILAVLISCLGLFGLASFVAEQRTKEIGIRKVLGASITQLWKLLSKDFVILVIISCAIAIPVGSYFMNEWLTQYEYRVTITWGLFAVTALGALVITLITVSFQAIKAALANPVKSLRSE